VDVVDTYDWLLTLHLFGVFAMAAAIVTFTAVIVAGRRTDRPSDALAVFRLALLGDVLIRGGALVALVFGIILAIEREAYQIWDGWIIASLVLFVVASVAGERSGKVYYAARDRARELQAAGEDGPSDDLRSRLRDSRALSLHLLALVSIVAILLLMIYKPGAG